MVLFGDAELTGQPWKPSPGKAASCLLVYREGESEIIYGEANGEGERACEPAVYLGIS